ncbi:hypothetical protein [Bergeyella sp. RCAD1439]|uniref:hypothetical protein n=1 Tax=Bergeyella anatis TaxID=3113737 RepID=UPI002E16F245|nr:hypothetical protein [Bergeyella sp. RCAD1439]
MGKHWDKFWIKISLFNFFLVAFMGALMRYKIVWSIPFLDQKHLQEAHSHFAFYGWISSVVYLLIFRSVRTQLPSGKIKAYQGIIGLNIVASYGMLFSFLWSGYYWGSIFWSALALILGWGMLGLWLRDYGKLAPHPSKLWFLGGLSLAAFSSAGVFSLVYLKASGLINPSFYMASTLFYLHFQYNGFFLFSCLGILSDFLSFQEKDLQKHRLVFWGMFFSVLGGYALSVTWLDRSGWLLGVAALGNILQLLSVWGLVGLVKSPLARFLSQRKPLEKIIFVVVAGAYFLKVILQQFSIIPEVSQWVFGFRTIVIAYLHLVLLVCISSFLLFAIVVGYDFRQTRMFRLGMTLYLVFVLLNELGLAQIGVLSLFGFYWRWSPVLLWWISVVLVMAVLFLFFGLRSKKNKEEIYSSL